jgi:hypothetical protein
MSIEAASVMIMMSRRSLAEGWGNCVLPEQVQTSPPEYHQEKFSLASWRVCLCGPRAGREAEHAITRLTATKQERGSPASIPVCALLVQVACSLRLIGYRTVGPILPGAYSTGYRSLVINK